MNIPVKSRLIAFAFGILLLGLMIGAAAYTTHTEVRQLYKRFAGAQLANFEIADHLQATTLKLNDALIRYELDHRPEDLDQFRRESGELNDWISRQKPLLSSENERELLNEIDRAYDIYLESASNAVTQIQAGKKDQLTSLRNLFNESIVMLELGTKLGEAHRAVLENFLTASRRSINLIQQVIFGALILLLLLAGGLAGVVSRDMIKPLRRQLVETNAILERQEKLAALGVLAAGVAHEIRNPLTAIKARLFIQQKSLGRNSAAFEDAMVIGAEINRLEKIVKEVLDFARPAEPRLVPMTADKVFTEAQTLLGPQMERTAIQLKIGPLSQSKFLGDAEQLKQVMINLIQNAADNIERDGQILLRARDSQAELKGKLKRVVLLEVQDNGKGMSPEVEKRLFDPFFSTKESGAGLGLSIAARIVQKHNGVLEYKTLLNRGTTFGIVLPLVPDET